MNADLIFRCTDCEISTLYLLTAEPIRAFCFQQINNHSRHTRTSSCHSNKALINLFLFKICRWYILWNSFKTTSAIWRMSGNPWPPHHVTILRHDAVTSGESYISEYPLFRTIGWCMVGPVFSVRDEITLEEFHIMHECLRLGYVVIMNVAWMTETSVVWPVMIERSSILVVPSRQNCSVN